MGHPGDKVGDEGLHMGPSLLCEAAEEAVESCNRCKHTCCICCMKIGNLIQRDLQNAADLTGDDEPTRMGRVDGNGGDRYSALIGNARR